MATIEVENKIIKHYDIKQRNLDLDKYLYERTNILKAVLDYWTIRYFGHLSKTLSKICPKPKHINIGQFLDISRDLKNFNILILAENYRIYYLTTY